MGKITPCWLICIYLKDIKVLGINFIWGTLCGLAYCNVNAITMQMHSVTMEEI